MKRTRQPHSDYANARRVITGSVETIRVPVAVLGQLLSELDDDARRYAEEALGPLLVQACIDIVTTDDAEENAA